MPRIQRHTPHSSTLNKSQLALWLATALALLAAASLPARAAPAAPSQTPLVNRPSSHPAPNVMLTLDDSGSMTYQYLPELPFQVNGHTVDFPDDAKVFLHPKELERNRFTFPPTGIPKFGDSFYITAAPLADLGTVQKQRIQKQMRSPEVNGLYYDPTVRYDPWKAADGTSYTAATPSKAWLDPSYLAPGATPPPASTDYVDLTTATKHSVNWYCDSGVGAGGSYNVALCNTPITLTYNPALIYLLNKGGDPNDITQYTDIDLNSIAAGGSITYTSALYTGTPDFSHRTDCVASTSSATCSITAELQNFANWFVFYRSRLMVAQYAMPEALRSVTGSIRLGWGTIHPKLTTTGGTETWGTFNPDADIAGTAIKTSPSIQQGVRTLNDTHLQNFTSWIRGLQMLRRTPSLHALQAVGEYFQRTGSLNPWQNNMALTADATAPLSCRRAYNLMVTDGYYATDDVLTSRSDNLYNFATGKSPYLTPIGNFDSAELITPLAATIKMGTTDSGSLSDAQAGRVFSDGLADTMADYAMYWWSTDLQPGINDDLKPITPDVAATDTTTQKLVKVVKSDPATWQHLSQLFIGFGVTGTITPTNDTPNDTALGNLLNGAAADGTVVSWPTSLSRIDDLWHAAINSRGQYFSARNPAQLETSLRDALASTQPLHLKEAGLATASTILQDGNIKYVPEYDPGKWSGNITAYPLDAKGNIGTKMWDANAKLPAPEARNIYIHDSTGTQPFLYGSISATTRTLLGTRVTDRMSLVNFIRGGPGNESMRQHDNNLPDFVNSPPLLVKQGSDQGYSTALTSMLGNGKSYTDYLEAKSKRTDGVLFIGGNGGMLHAFSTSMGTEQFAYIPSAAIPKLTKLAQPSYGLSDNYHEYFVDGPLVEADVCPAADGATSCDWQDVVVGTTGRGGKSVFALKVDVASPNSLGAGSVLWDVTHDDMGYITSLPVVARLPNGKWTVFVGNGVSSTNDHAALLLVDVASGAVSSIPVDDNGSGTGLGGVTLMADRTTGVVTTIYAGDTKGRMWRFDVSSSGISPGYATKPLFTATAAPPDDTVPQPILAAPAVVAHPKGGQMVVFNTGRLMFEADSSDTSPQSAYGVWDKEPAGTNTSDKLAPSISRSNLQVQTIDQRVNITQADGTIGTFFTLSSNPIDSWTSKYGWLLDLKVPDLTTADLATGSQTYSYPKAIYDPILFGRSVLINSIKPGAVKEACVGTNGVGYSFLVKALTGAMQVSSAAIDTNGDGVINSSDAKEGGYAFGGGGQTVLGGKGTGNGNPLPGSVIWYGSGSGKKVADLQKCLEGNVQNAIDGKPIQDCGDFRIQDRVWRQLLNPPQP